MTAGTYAYEIDEIKKLCRLDYTNQEMADYLDIRVQLIRNTVKADKTFRDLLNTRSKAAIKGKKRGKKRTKFNLAQVKKLCKLSCTDEELAAYFGVNVMTVSREKKRNKAFAEAIIEGRDNGKLSLRRKQIKVAMSGNPTMLIWLGKQYLLQKEKHEVSGPNGGPLETTRKVIRVRSRKAN